MQKERNPFYVLLVVASVAFIVTVLAHAAVPWDQQPAWLKEHGWQLLLIEVGVLIVLGLLSMGLDRLRTQRMEREKSNSAMNPERGV